MTTRNFDALFAPKAIALIGASDRPGSVGAVIAHNLATGGFAGPLFFVNQRDQTIEGRKTYPSVAALPQAPDLAVVATPPDGAPQLVADLAARNCRASIVISAGFGDAQGALRRRLFQAARPNLMRILGPNCLGFQSPGNGINASFAHVMPKQGHVALVSQSGAVLAALLDWAAGKGVGFSHVVSLGDMNDIDFGDMLDHLALDPATDAILLYVENVTHARKFMSAGRIAARAKPVIVVKAGRSAAGAIAAATHTGALAGSDVVYDAAFRRAGMLRVEELEHLFDAAEILSSGERVQGERLTIITNGGGAGVMAADSLQLEGGLLADLPEPARRRLDTVLPSNWSRANPIDIIGDAREERYRAAVEAVVEDGDQDAILVMNCPTGVADSRKSAEAVAAAGASAKVPILTCWLGEATAQNARRLFRERGWPTFDTPADAVRAFMQLAKYRRNQGLLLETPARAPRQRDTAAARAVVLRALEEGRAMLNEPEAKTVLAAYGVPTVETVIAATPSEAGAAAARLKGRVALKILSPDISHKSDVGGVRLNLEGAEAVAAAGKAMLASVAAKAPAATLAGFTVQHMIERPKAVELIAGFHTDPTFGPVLLFGAGGVAVEVVADRAMALPPLNSVLARDLIGRTRIAKLLEGYRNVAPADLAAIEDALLSLSDMIADLPEIAALDINPLLADAEGVVALDARIEVQPGAAAREMAIRPYPSALAQPVTLAGGATFDLRPIRPEDETALIAMTQRSSPDDRPLGVFGSVSPHALAARLSQIDYDREMTLVAVEPGAGSIAALSRLAFDPNFEQADYMMMVRADLRGQGLGLKLTQAMLDYALSRGARTVSGVAAADNRVMLNLAKNLGAAVEPVSGGAVRIRFSL